MSPDKLFYILAGVGCGEVISSYFGIFYNHFYKKDYQPSTARAEMSWDQVYTFWGAIFGLVLLVFLGVFVGNFCEYPAMTCIGFFMHTTFLNRKSLLDMFASLHGFPFEPTV